MKWWSTSINSLDWLWAARPPNWNGQNKKWMKIEPQPARASKWLKVNNCSTCQSSRPFFECSHSRNYYEKATRQLWVGRKTPRQKIDETDKKPTGTGFILSQSKKRCTLVVFEHKLVISIGWPWGTNVCETLESIVVAKYVSFHCKRRNGTRSCNIR